MKPVKDYPKEFKKAIKKNVKLQGEDWSVKKEGNLSNAFVWGASFEGHDFWSKLNNIMHGFKN